MAVYVVTGKLGSGKTLTSVSKIKERLQAGLKVATNLDIDLPELLGPMPRKVRLLRIPDKPTIDDLNAIGIGNESYDEEKNGLLVLDECGTWFNSRSWADKERQKVINWFLHARKLGWDIIFLIQDVSMMDKQARISLGEHVVYCRRLDRLPVPFLGVIVKLISGHRLKMPKVHVAVVKYGEGPNALTVDTWVYRGHDLYSSYDTKQTFSDSYEHGPFSYLPPWYTVGFKRVPRDKEFYMRMTKIVWKRFSRPVVAAAGVVLGITLMSAVDVVGVTQAKDRLVDLENRLNAPVVDETSVLLSSYEGTKILGYRRLGDVVAYSLQLPDGLRVDSSELVRQGLTVESVDRCNLALKHGDQNVQVRC